MPVFNAAMSGVDVDMARRSVAVNGAGGDRGRRHRSRHRDAESTVAVVSGDPVGRRRMSHGGRVHVRHYTVPTWRTRSEISCCVKYSVFGFNVLFWLIGVTLLLIGAWAQIEKNPYSEIGPKLSKFYLDPAWILFIVGALVFIIGLNGCIGALRENTFLLACYATMLGVLLLTQLAAAALAFVSKDRVRNELERELDDMVVSYRDDPDLQAVIDWIQKDWLFCCGIYSPDDWSMNIYFNESSEAIGSPEAGGVPFSCCKTDNAEFINLYCGHGVRKKDYKGTQEYYETGCLPKLLAWLDKHVMQVTIALMTVTVLEILGICFAQNLRSDIFAQRARWYYSH